MSITRLMLLMEVGSRVDEGYKAKELGMCIS